MCCRLAGCLLILFNFYMCKCEVLMTSFFYGGVIRCIASLSWTQLTSISRAWMAVLLKLLQKLEKSVMLSKLRGKRWQEISFWITNVLHGSFFLFSVFHLASSQGKKAETLSKFSAKPCGYFSAVCTKARFCYKNKRLLSWCRPDAGPVRNYLSCFVLERKSQPVAIIPGAF